MTDSLHYLNRVREQVSYILQSLDDALQIIEERRMDGSAVVQDELVFTHAVKTLKSSQGFIAFVLQNIDFLVFQESLIESSVRTERDSLVYLHRGVIAPLQSWVQTNLSDRDDELSQSIAVEVRERLEKCQGIVSTVLDSLDSSGGIL